MKITKLDGKKNVVKAVVKSYSDLIFLQYIFEDGDELTAYSRRKVVVGKSQEIKTIKVSVIIEKIKLMETSLDVGGKITYSSDENVPLHKYHTIQIKRGTGFILKKRRLLHFQVRLLRQAAETSPKVFICVYEEGRAFFYVMANYRIKRKMDFEKAVSGKRFKNGSRKEFFTRLSVLLSEEYQKGYNAFVVAGKAMDNEELRKSYLKDKNIAYETVSYADTGLKELLLRNSINEVLSKARLSIQRQLINEYLLGISKNDKHYLYGKEEIAKAISERKAQQALVSKEYVLNNKEIIEKLDGLGCEIVLFDENDESLTQLDSFGGILVKFTDI
jgi:stalled ribosome rescue protein Dom34